MKTTDPRVRVENYGRENWRTVARDDSGDWAITGPPYPTRAEALLAVGKVVRDYFGEPSPQPATVCRLRERAESYALDARRLGDAIRLGQPITDEDAYWQRVYTTVAAELRKVAAEVAP